MHTSILSDYRFTRRQVLAAGLLTPVALAVARFTGAAAGQGTFGSGGQVEGGYKYADGPYPVTYNNKLYVYGTGSDGGGYYNTYDGNTYSPAQPYYPGQATKYQGRQVAVVYGGKQYVYAYGQDNKYYATTYDGQSYSTPRDVSGGYSYIAPPYAFTYQDKLYLYGVASDYNLYAQAYDGKSYSPPQKVNGSETVGAYQPYAVDYGDYANIFYVTQDGKSYWNRYNGTAYTGAKALPGNYTFGYSPYAIGYPVDQKLYVYAVSTDGVPYYNVFTPGQGFSGYTPYGSPPPVKVKYQPSAYVYQNVQHVVYTGADGHAYYNEYQNGAYSDYADLGPNYAYTPIQYEYGGKYYLSYTGQDGYVYYKTYSGPGNKVAGPATTAPAYPPTPTPYPSGGSYAPTPTPSY